MLMKYSNALIIILLSVIVCCNSGKKNPDQHTPNIILIIGDDHGYPYFGFMGSEHVHTPNMDTLANSGVLFTNGYVPDNHCRPVLQSLVTGMLPINYKNKLNSIRAEKRNTLEYLSLDTESKNNWEKEFDYHGLRYFETMPGQLQKKGYKSFQTGKWWEYHYRYGGFTDGMTQGWVREKRNGMNWFQQFMGGEGTQIGRISNQPVYDFIIKNKQDPFFIWYAPQLPHYPFDSPQKYRDIYKDKGYSRSAVEYYANCSWFDNVLGELIQFLKVRDLFDNTLFIYVNDNGWEQEPDQEFINDPMRSHNGGDKGKLSIYDVSFRTPIIFSWKDHIKSGIRRTDLVHSTDIPATILDIVGLDKEIDHFGNSIKDMILGKGNGNRTRIIGNSNKIRDDKDPMGRDVEAYWIREQNWFFNWNITDNKQSLYDIENDPYCNNDEKINNPEIALRLKDAITKWRKEKIRS